MKNCYYIVLSIMLLSCLKHGKSNSLPTDQEINNTIKEIYELKLDSETDSEWRQFIQSNPITIRPNINLPELTLNNESEKYFSKKDLKYMIRQRQMIKNCHLDSTILNDYKIITSEGDDYKGLINEFTIPLYSLDRKTIILTEGYNRGVLSGYSYTSIYKKNNHNWELVYRSDKIRY
ncbi:hypothetical protein [Carboxylicivirga sp. RSCT41]|uniref:hypothetical protein n=1 Tax=Carboxylicivirga agarovorans TaxID=3417570 RepID=UPI003D3482E9